MSLNPDVIFDTRFGALKIRWRPVVGALFIDHPDAEDVSVLLNGIRIAGPDPSTGEQLQTRLDANPELKAQLQAAYNSTELVPRPPRPPRDPDAVFEAAPIKDTAACQTCGQMVINIQTGGRDSAKEWVHLQGYRVACFQERKFEPSDAEAAESPNG